MKFLTKFPVAPAPHEAGRARLALLVALVAGTALAVRVALPLWSTLTPATSHEQQLAPAITASNTKPDLALLQSLPLFDGDVESAPAPAAALPALNTALNLRLEGVMLAGDGENHQAVILGSAGRGSYRVGDSLPANANVKVVSIARDHAIIDNRGQREVLWLYSNAQPASSAPAVVMPSQTTAFAGNALNGTASGIVPPPGTDERVAKTAVRLAEIISVAPEVVNGQLAGYRLSPGLRLKDFVQLGFQTNDIVTAVNGIALNDVANLSKLYGLMDEATEVSFSLLRDGVPLQLKVTLDPAMSAAK
ncbi:MAG: type II secretion system protein N [Pseudomonadota bacterium]|nr:type II secretion system protein N [Pseudomonadota bacterium]